MLPRIVVHVRSVLCVNVMSRLCDGITLCTSHKRVCCRNGMNSVNEHGRPIPLNWHVVPRCNAHGRKRGKKPSVSDNQCKDWSAERSPPPDFVECCTMVAPATERTGTVDKIALFHFATKSEEDFALKQRRGSGMSGGTKTMDYFNQLVKYAIVAPASLFTSALLPAAFVNSSIMTASRAHGIQHPPRIAFLHAPGA
jgi:hypothetical protein